MSNSHILVRLPEDAKLWLKNQAIANSSTMTAEVVRSIRQRMENAHPVREVAKST